MQPDDPRHGTKAGRSQHHRDGEEACQACKDADNTEGRRRRKRKQQGLIYRRPIGDTLHAQLVDLRSRATYQQLADWSGVSFSQVYRAINDGPTHRVNASTWLRLNNINPAPVATLIGLTRRLQALQRLGYSSPRICAEIGMTLNGIKPLRDGTATGPINHEHRDAIVDLYNRWHMTNPATDTTNQRKSVTRARNHAEAMGWMPPLAWDDIDDETQRPDPGWRPVGNYAADELLTEFEHLRTSGVSVELAAAQLNRTVEAIEKATHRAKKGAA